MTQTFCHTNRREVADGSCDPCSEENPLVEVEALVVFQIRALDLTQQGATSEQTGWETIEYELRDAPDLAYALQRLRPFNIKMKFIEVDPDTEERHA